MLSYLSSSSTPPAASNAVLDERLGWKAVPAELAKSMQNRRSRKLRRGEISDSFGNDQRLPWQPSLNSRSQIKVVGQFSGGYMNSNATLPQYAAMNFKFSDIDNYTNLANVFDQYRIDLVEIQIFPSVTDVTTTAGDVGTIVTAIDLDDSTPPLSYLQLQGRASAVSSSATKTHFHRFKPCFATAAYSGAFTSYTSSTGWVDCSSPNVEHYGVKGATNPVTGQLVNFRFNAKLHITLRSLH